MTLAKKLNRLASHWLLDRSHNLVGNRRALSRSQSCRRSFHRRIRRKSTNSGVVIQGMIPTRTVLGGERCLCRWFEKWVGTTCCMNLDSGDFFVTVGPILALGKEPGAPHGQPRGMKPQLRRL